MAVIVTHLEETSTENSAKARWGKKKLDKYKYVSENI